MQITRLAKTTSGSKINVYVDGRYAVSVLVDTLVREGLYVDKEITKADLDRISGEDMQRGLYERSVALVLARPRSEYELKVKLSEWLRKKNPEQTEDQKVVSSIIEKLKQNGYLEDLNFAKWWIESRKSFKAKSVKEIKLELLKKGVKSEIINELIKEQYSEQEEREAIQKIIAKKLRTRQSSKLDQEQKLKLTNYLLRKGFRWEVIKSEL